MVASLMAIECMLIATDDGRLTECMLIATDDGRLTDGHRVHANCHRLRLIATLISCAQAAPFWPNAEGGGRLFGSPIPTG